MKTYVVMNRKGGTGKTITSLALADGLKHNGYRSLLIDLDPQRSASLLLGADETEKSMCSALTGKLSIAECIVNTFVGDFIPAGHDLAIIGDKLKGEYLTLLRDLLTDVADNYDVCIIDCSPGLSPVSVSGLIAADELIIPTNPDATALFSLGLMHDAIALARVHNKTLRVAGILPTLWDSRPVIYNKMLEVAEKMAGQFGSKVFATRIRRGKDVPEAIMMHKGIISYDVNGRVAKDYLALLDELGYSEGGLFDGTKVY